MNKIFLGFLKGIFIGLANIIPGVSGGTIAVIFGIFDDLIDTINNFFRDIKKNLGFITPIGFGILFSILFFSSILELCLKKYSLPTNIFFVGLIFGSIPIIYKKAIKNGIKKNYFLYTIISILIVILASNFNKNGATQINHDLSFIFLLKIFFGGLLAAIAMIIPGISGSFIMVVLGIYPTVINSISNISRCLLNLSDKNLLIRTGAIIFSLGLGLFLGILLISRLISVLLEKFYSETYFCILGLIIGSIYGIFASPMTYQSGINNFMILISVISFFVGAIISYFLGEKN